MQTDEQRRLLGAFVRTRRESMAPEGHDRRRRTPGLRREELAARAAIGTTWVAWIEQGRDVRPSAETLSRLAVGLSLSVAERDYLFALAGRHDPVDPFAHARQAAPLAISALVERLDWPCYALDPAWAVCAANEAARRLFVGLFEGDAAPTCCAMSSPIPPPASCCRTGRSARRACWRNSAGITVMPLPIRVCAGGRMASGEQSRFSQIVGRAERARARRRNTNISPPR